MGLQPCREAWGKLVPGPESTGFIRRSYSWAPDVWTAQTPHPTLDHRCSEQMCPSLRLGLSSGCHLWARASVTLHWLRPICLHVWANDHQSWFLQTAVRWMRLRHREPVGCLWSQTWTPSLHLASDSGGWGNVMACPSIWASVLFRNPTWTTPLYHSWPGCHLGGRRKEQSSMGASPFVHRFQVVIFLLGLWLYH